MLDTGTFWGRGSKVWVPDILVIPKVVTTCSHVVTTYSHLVYLQLFSDYLL